jgi:hypothetical protein
MMLRKRASMIYIASSSSALMDQTLTCDHSELILKSESYR